MVVAAPSPASKRSPSVAPAAPLPPTPTSRKLAHLLATSAPSRGSSSSTEPRLQVELPRSGWRSALWPSSPVFRKKLHLVSSPSSRGSSGGKSSSDSDSPRAASDSELVAPLPLKARAAIMQREPQDDDSDDTGDSSGADSNASSPLSVAGLSFTELARRAALRSFDKLSGASPAVVSVRLHGGELHVQAAQQQHEPRVHPVLMEPAKSAVLSPASRTPPSAEPSDSNNAHERAAAAKRSSVEQELAEFCANSELKIVMFPEYFADDEKALVQQVAEALRLGCQIGERNVAVFKTGEACDKGAALARAARSRSSSSDDDVFVDVSELAQQGKDCFIARLRLRRLSSGSGVRRNMLWDVAELAQTDGVAAPVSEGGGGVYAVQSRSSGQKLAMFKPAEEETFVRDGLIPGEGAVREEAAYVLDSRSGGFSGVPPTAVARLQLSTVGRAKQGSVQRFMASSIGSMEGFGMPFDLAKADAFVPVDQVHRIGLLDVRVFNTDRHPGNILLIGEKAPYTMVPIDHGCILPSWFHLSEARFDWLEYPQAKVPFGAPALAYIEALDAVADAHALRRLGIREECVTALKICTLFLQRAARAGKTLFWIGTFLQRGGCFEAPSALELLVQRACDATGVPFVFVPNEFGEQKGYVAPGVLSRRPPAQFFHALEQLVDTAVRSDD
ncbi:hypothetical protein PybrP1_005889 [[Pythium] brassicae (nom. inval.)]|nr:hypothetical protein PybrP1_005889 [[Pythium] brassicae (nom. inval.)]